MNLGHYVELFAEANGVPVLGRYKAKTALSDRMIAANFVEEHIRIGVEALKLVRRYGGA